jgi:hypothetical protein
MCVGWGFLPSPPAPLPRGGRGVPRAKVFGVLKRQLQRWAEASLPHSISPSPQGFWSAEASASALGGSFASALHIPLSRWRERGTQGVRAKKHVCLALTEQVKIKIAPEIPYLTSVSLLAPTPTLPASG